MAHAFVKFKTIGLKNHVFKFLIIANLSPIYYSCGK